ncbi:MAG: glycosyltransferase [Muribaculaceae bacterium]|nr:glycosyltransferase [Muribaculaceae bacterium]
MIFSFDITLPVWILLGVSLLPVLWLLSVYRCRVAAVGKAASSSPDAMPMIADTDYPEVSIVVYSAGEPARLEALLGDIFGQDYPVDMEVIVVNDGKIPEIKGVVERMRASHHNLYITFTPPDVRNLSRRKLALTLGIKAARKGVVVLTDDCCAPASDWWLRMMTAPFADSSVQMVIGHAYPDSDSGFGSSGRGFSLGADALEYMSAVLRGRTYRANGHNLAYRTRLFFENKGFSRSLNLHDGDDDLFVSEVSRPGNTVLVASPGAHMAVWHADTRRAYRQEKTRRSFTGRMLRQGTRLFFGFSTLLMWLWLAAAVAASVLAWPNASVAAAELVMALIFWIPLSLTWKRTLRSLSIQVSAWSIPWRLLMRPVTTLRFRLRASRHKSENYTWKN